MNHLPFRQESSFLYLTGCATPNAALLLTEDEERLFLPKPADDDSLWHGATPSIEEQGKALGFELVADRAELSSYLSKIPQKPRTIATADLKINLELEHLLGTRFRFGPTAEGGDPELIQWLCHSRRILEEEELAELRATMSFTARAHKAAMSATHVGGHEREVAAAFHYELAKAGLGTAYSSIVTVDGHILHNHHYRNELQDGQLLLLDGGAESVGGYATDITRTWPVNGRFSAQQRAAYSAVLEAQKASINMIRAGTRYRDVHFKSCEIIAQFLCSEQLLLCSPEEAVESGAHALFFPHGIGHLIGLDVHDLENFGDVAAYAPDRSRSQQFGTAYLRMDLDLEPNMVVTIEPGFYIIPEILNNEALMAPHRSRINQDRLEAWRHFGGIRIEDNILCTEGEPENLSWEIPKEISELEPLINLQA